MLAALSAHHVQVIYAMPDLGEALIAEWQRHAVETSRAVPLEAWIAEVVAGEHPAFWQAYDLEEVFRRWDVPPGDLHVVVAPHGGLDADGLWERFASVIGAPVERADGTPPSNIRLGLDELDLLRRVDERWNDRGITEALAFERDRLIRAMLANGRQPRPALLPSEHRSWIEKQATLQRDHLAASGVDIVGDLVDLEITGSRFDAGGAMPDETCMLASGIDAIAGLVDRMTSHYERREQIEREGRTKASPPNSVRHLVRRTRRVVTSPTAARFAVRRRVRVAFASRGRRAYFLHIGAPKSGSSYLQSLLWRNRHALMRDGVYLPGRSQTDHFYAGTDFRGRPYVTQTDEDQWRGAWDRMIEDAERSGCRRIVDHQ